MMRPFFIISFALFMATGAGTIAFAFNSDSAVSRYALLVEHYEKGDFAGAEEHLDWLFENAHWDQRPFSTSQRRERFLEMAYDIYEGRGKLHQARKLIDQLLPYLNDDARRIWTERRNSR